MRQLDFDWDENKRRDNIEKHGVDLLFAAAIFDGDTVTQRDMRNEYGEERFQTIGYVDGECYVVVYAERDGIVRLISARRGGRRDRRRYQKGNAGRDSGHEGQG